MGERGFYGLSDSKLQITTASELSNLFIQALSVIIPKETTKTKNSLLLVFRRNDYRIHYSLFLIYMYKTCLCFYYVCVF